MTLHMLLIVVALVCFAFGAIDDRARPNLVSAGLFSWLLAATFVG